MTEMGSIAEWPEFFRTVAKPTCRFRDPALDPLMAESGWEADIHNHHQPDDLGRGVEVPERTNELVGSGHQINLTSICYQLAHLLSQSPPKRHSIPPPISPSDHLECCQCVWEKILDSRVIVE